MKLSRASHRPSENTGILHALRVYRLFYFTSYSIRCKRKLEVIVMLSTQIGRLVTSLFDEKRLHEKVGSAWRLFFFICSNSDNEKELTTSYPLISQRLGVSISTVKTWRKILVKNLVVRSYTGGHVVHFRILEPFKAILQDREVNTT